MENGLKNLVDLGASAIHRAYILNTKCQDSTATMHAHRSIIAALEALGLTDEAIDALLAGKAAVVPIDADGVILVRNKPNYIGGPLSKPAFPAFRLDKPVEDR